MNQVRSGRRTAMTAVIAAAVLIASLSCEDKLNGPADGGGRSLAKGKGGVTPPPPPPAGVITGGNGMTAAPSGTVTLDQVCDFTLVPAGTAPAPGTLPVAAGTTVQLVRQAYDCVPTVDAAGALVTGMGLSVNAPQITIDLNGATIRSTLNVDAISGGAAENQGILVGANNVTITNRATAAATLITGFTINLDFASMTDGVLQGLKLASGDYNIQLVDSRPAAALKLQRASRITISQILADATGPDGTRGVDVILSNNVLFTNGATLRGRASGIRFRDSFDARIENSSICGFTIDHIEFARNVQNVVQTNNTFCDRALVCITTPPAP